MARPRCSTPNCSGRVVDGKHKAHKVRYCVLLVGWANKTNRVIGPFKTYRSAWKWRERKALKGYSVFVHEMCRVKNG